MALDPITAGLNTLSTVIDKIFPDKTEAEKIKVRMFELQKAGELEEVKLTFQAIFEQLKVNANEALHQSVFVAGWRPFIGWVCGFSLAYTYIIQPFYTWTIKCFLPEAPPPPTLDITELVLLVGGMLGIAGIRSREVIQGKR